jgi:signal transduction histidine kinase
MTFLYDKQTRRCCAGLACTALLTFLLAAVLCYSQAQAAKGLLLAYDRAVVSALLEQGVPEAALAVALKNPSETPRGAAFLSAQGWSDSLPLFFVPEAQHFFTYILPPALLCTLAVLLLSGGVLAAYFLRRERLYQSASAALDRLVEGDFSKHLPRGGEGTLYALFAKADTLAMALQAKSESERSAKQSLKDAVSDISHQLKTPLAALQLYNEILTSEADNPDTVRSFAQKSALSLSRMEQLILSLLKVMRLDAGTVPFQKERISVAELVQDAAQELTTRAKEENKRLAFGTDGGETILCDPQWTREALGNLIKNALDHTKPGGQVQVVWKRSPAMLRISVQDDGEGIAPDDMPFIFKRFYRSRHGSDTQGIGLGLPLAKSILEGQGAALSVQSEPGHGATFTIAFLTEL